MAINLSTLTFTNQADIVPDAGTTAEIINTDTANTLAGNDTITGIGETPLPGPIGGDFTRGISNAGTIDTSVGNDKLQSAFRGNREWGTGNRETHLYSCGIETRTLFFFRRTLRLKNIFFLD
jgi:hypothetical protein